MSLSGHGFLCPGNKLIAKARQQSFRVTDHINEKGHRIQKACISCLLPSSNRFQHSLFFSLFFSPLSLSLFCMAFVFGGKKKMDPPVMIWHSSTIASTKPIFFFFFSFYFNFIILFCMAFVFTDKKTTTTHNNKNNNNKNPDPSVMIWHNSGVLSQSGLA